MIRRVLMAMTVLAALVQSAAAEDLDIFKAGAGAKPNVMIVFDNSDFMFNCIGTNNSNDRICNDYVKLKIARDVLLNIVASPIASELRIGLMSFVKDSRGEAGKVHLPCGASTAALQEKIRFIAGPDNTKINQSDLYSGGTWSPLAEALAEAGLYFGGKQSAFLADWPIASKYVTPETATVDGAPGVTWFGASGYVSPITHACQNNYVIFFTTGEPKDVTTLDNNPVIQSSLPGLTNGLAAEQYSVSNSNRIELFEDVAWYLHNTDFNSSLPGKQNVKTNIIGFDLYNTTEGAETKEGTKKAALDAAELMGLAAKAGNGGEGGHFFAVKALRDSSGNVLTDASGNIAPAVVNQMTAELQAAFEGIFDTIISEADAGFAAPAVPLDPDSQVDAGDRIFMAFFKPQRTGRWIGNLKAYARKDGIAFDANDQPAIIQATDPDYIPGYEGYIKDSARSLWNWLPADETDGFHIDQGGAGKLLAGRTDRTVYSYLGANPDLKNASGTQSNLFATTNTNPALTPALLGVATVAERDAVITQTRNGPAILPGNTTTPINWPLGDIVHSQPLVADFEATYDNGVIESGETTKRYLFVGANDGMLHVFNAADGREEWAFIPPGQLGNLKKRTTLYSGTEHTNYVDGSPVLATVKKADNSSMRLLIFGERRGGKRYYALDVTNPDQPVFKFQLTDTLLSSLDWDGVGGIDGAAAALGQSWATPQFKKVRAGNTVREVFLLAGGYDTNQDATTPAASDSVGRSIYAVRADTGAVFGLNINAGNWKDASGIPYMTHAILDVTAFDKGNKGYVDRLYAGDLGGHLFAARYNACTDTDCTNDSWEKRVLFDLTGSTLGKKIMNRPEVALEPGKECVYFGTGNREKPTDKTTVNALYAVCNSWADSQPQPLTTAHLVDVTGNLVQQGTAEEQAAAEAALAAGYGWYFRLPNVGERVVSTPKLLNGKLYFTTYTPADIDPCGEPFDFGTSRLYAVNYKTGAAVYNFNADDQWSKEDRSKIISSMIAGDLLLTTDGATTSLYYGAGGKIEGMPIETDPVVRRYFWRQLK